LLALRPEANEKNLLEFTRRLKIEEQ
jgi:hypothetical protein